MKGLGIAAVAGAVALFGCGPKPASQQETPPTATASAADRPMTVVGCLVAAGATQQSDAAGNASSPPPPSFTLVDATIAAPAGTSGTSGTTNPPAATNAQSSYSLVADTDRLADLQRFANSRVEISGSIVASTGTGASDIAAGSAPAGAPPTDPRRLRVTDVRRLERTCADSRR